MKVLDVVDRVEVWWKGAEKKPRATKKGERQMNQSKKKSVLFEQSMT